MSDRYKCKLCEKDFASMSSRSNHINRIHKHTKSPNVVNVVISDVKNEVKLNNICKYCNKKLCDRKSRWRHEQKCKNSDNNNNKLLVIEKELAELKKIIETNKSVSNTNNGHINNGTINDNSKKVIINNFNNDNLNYISNDFLTNMFKHLRCEDDYHKPIPELIEKMKFNPKHLENNNVKITNKRSDIGMKYDNDKWITVDKDDLLDDLFRIGFKTFNKFYKEKYNKNTEGDFSEAVKTELKNKIKTKIEKIAYLYGKNTPLDKLHPKVWKI